MSEKLLTRYIHEPAQVNLQTFVLRGGYQGARRALCDLTPDQVIAEVDQSGLRGKGGAGFPAGFKWKAVPRDAPVKYVVVNADESEPGTFKDRLLLEHDPHQLIEGILIAAYAIGAHKAFVYTRGEFFRAREVLMRAMDEAAAYGYLGRHILGTDFDLEIVVHAGAGAYIAGEESGLLESLEGKRAMPRLRPPYPAQKGLYGQPTLLNNVETLCHVGHILRLGADGYKAHGMPALFSVSGHVARPGVYELPLGTPLREMIFEHAGGMHPARRFKACFPGGSSSAILVEEHLDTPMDYDSLRKAGSMLGSAAVIVMDDTTCMVKVIARAVEFYRDESCGKCTPCREGTVWMSQVLERVLHGHGRTEDLDLMAGIAKGMTGTCLCPLGESVPPSLGNSLRYFREEYEAHIRTGRCNVAVPA
ncbi:MAG: NADH-quinone oxidoreductase subunit NuoF [Armatimonadetes bacterium]|nr:NADH-quinone oxidoreductase subunit NuoF [Armatimonadota bacterium]